jgi:hypothetical protein
VLQLPAGWVPELIVSVGYPQPEQPAAMAPWRLRWQDLTQWVPAE